MGVYFIFREYGITAGSEETNQDHFRLLLDDGNCNRRTVNVKNIKLTDLSVEICHGARPGTVKKVLINVLTTADPQYIFMTSFYDSF